MARGKLWEFHEDCLLRELHGAKTSLFEICRQIGRPRTSVATRIKVLGIGKKRPIWTEDHQRKAEQMRREGMRFYQIGEVLGFRPGTVAKYIKIKLEQKEARRALPPSDVVHHEAIREDGFIKPPSRAQLMGGR